MGKVDAFNNYEITKHTGGTQMKKFTKQIKNEKGMTLIELLAVIVILAIIAAIAVPAIGGIINNSRDKALLANASSILAGAKIAHVDGACKTTADTCSATELKEYVEGITLGANDKVVKGSDGVWTVHYSELTKIKSTTKFQESKKGSVSETVLNKEMQN